MGYDKPNLAFVVHFQVPGSAVAYYQQVGRAGRAIDQAFAIALSGREDRQIQDWFISTAFPSREHAEQVVALVAERGDWVKLAEIERDVNLRRSRLTNMLKVLEVEGVVERDGQKWRRTATAVGVPAGPRRRGHRAPPRGAGRACASSSRGRAASWSSCAASSTIREAAPCGRCARCLGHSSVPAHGRRRARARGGRVPAQPVVRARAAQAVARRQAHPGQPSSRAGSDPRRLGRRRLGPTVAERERAGGAFGDELVDALVELSRGKAPDPMPTWVTCVPSLRHPELVPVARGSLRGARAAAVPARRRARPGRPRRRRRWTTPRSSTPTSRGAFALSGPVPDGPAYLVDDTVDSRWTLTVVAALLRRDAGPGRCSRSCSRRSEASSRTRSTPAAPLRSQRIDTRKRTGGRR